MANNMPGFITHYICGQASLRQLPREARETLERRSCIYNLGAQGPDIFFYYLPGLALRRMRGVGALLHTQKVGVFIQGLTDEITGAKTDEEREILYAYTAGYLSHYALDAGAHPYIYAMTAHPKPFKQSVSHRKFETAIDVLMLKLLSGEKPADYKLWQLVKADAEQSRTAARAVSSALNRAYGRGVSPRDVYKAMVYMVQLTRMLQSKNGGRRRLMELAENLTVREPVVTSIIHPQAVNDGVDYLNYKKAVWNAETGVNTSFIEMYGAAADDAAEMASMLYMYLNGSVSRMKLFKRLGSRSLATGEPLPWRR